MPARDKKEVDALPGGHHLSFPTPICLSLQGPKVVETISCTAAFVFNEGGAFLPFQQNSHIKHVNS